MAATQVWLIIEASSGIGAVLEETTLKAGHRVIATVRNPVRAAEAHPQIEALGTRWIRLDVTAQDTNRGLKTQ